MECSDVCRRGCAGLLLPLLVAVATPVSAECQLQQAEIPVHMVDRRPVATITLNGTEVRMLVDSGAFFSMLTPSTATQLNLPLRPMPRDVRIYGYAGQIDVKLTKVQTMGLLGAQLPNVEFMVGGNEIGGGIMGILGRNVLSMADVEYDLAHGAVRLTFPKGDCDESSMAYWADSAPVIEVPLERYQRNDTALRLEVKLNGKKTTALMDTGATQTALTLRAARRAGIEESTLTPSDRRAGVGKGYVKSWTGRLASFELGGEKISNSLLEINDTDLLDDGVLLGLDYFLSHRIYVSRRYDKAFITWGGGPVFTRDEAASPVLDPSQAASASTVDAHDASALARRGAAALAAGNVALAQQDLDRACELEPSNAEFRFTRARLHLKRRQLEVASSDLDAALRLDPVLAEARFMRAALRAASRDHAAAQEDLAHLDAQLHPTAHLRLEMAKAYSSMQQYQLALRQFDFWVTHHPNDNRLADALNSRCWLRARQNLDLPLALLDCQRAVDLDADSAANRDSLGWVYLRLGDAVRAKKAFDSALRIRHWPLSLYGRGLALLRLNDRGGERDLNAARELKPSIDDEVRELGFDAAEASSASAPAAEKS